MLAYIRTTGMLRGIRNGALLSILASPPITETNSQIMALQNGISMRAEFLVGSATIFAYYCI